MAPQIDDNSCEGGDGGSPSQGSPSPDRDRPAVGTETGEMQGQGAPVDQEPQAPLTPEEAEAVENRERANKPDGSTGGERMSPPSGTPSLADRLADPRYLATRLEESAAAARHTGLHGVDYVCTKDGDYVSRDEADRGPSPLSRLHDWESGIDPSTGEKFALRRDTVPPPDNLRQNPGPEGLGDTVDAADMEAITQAGIGGIAAMAGHEFGGNDPGRHPDAARSGQAIDGLAISAAGMAAARTAISDLNASSERAPRDELEPERRAEASPEPRAGTVRDRPERAADVSADPKNESAERIRVTPLIEADPRAPIDTRQTAETRLLYIGSQALENGAHRYRAIGEAGKTTQPRAGFESRYEAPQGFNVAHLWSRDLGGESAAGMTLAPDWFNRSAQRYMEIRISEANQAAKAAGNRVFVEATVTTKPVQADGREFLDTVRYRAFEVDDRNRPVVEHFDVELSPRADGRIDIGSKGLLIEDYEPPRTTLSPKSSRDR
jgi:hypothetical protein